MTIDIIISTFNDRIQQCKSVLLEYRKDVSYKISHQITDDKYIKCIPCEIIERQDVSISTIRSIGISNNRNNSISMATADICIIADDDVKYTKEYIDTIISTFNNNPHIDIITGKINTLDSNKDFKVYDHKDYSINYLNLTRISSIEIAFRRKSVIENGVKFDANWGIGGNLFHQGEESIFICDCLKKGLKVRYFPNYMVDHPYESSGKNTDYNYSHIIYWGALCRRLYGYIAFMMIIPLAIKHYPRWKNAISILQYIKGFIVGYKLIGNHR